MQKPTWKSLLARPEPLLLPCAHDALSARLIERAGFAAYSIGGFPLVGARHALPDIGLAGFGEMHAGMRDVIAASSLPVLIDADDGYGDVKNVTRTIRAYEELGASAIFIEDQRSPKERGRARAHRPRAQRHAAARQHAGRRAHAAARAGGTLSPRYSMIAYPTTLIFRVARTIEKALADLKSGTLDLAGEGVDFEQFKEITGFAEWAAVEDAAQAKCK
jgi:hypothetical protein